MSKASTSTQTQAKQKKPVLDIPGRKKYSSFKDYIKDVENILAELHIVTTRKGK